MGRPQRYTSVNSEAIGPTAQFCVEEQRLLNEFVEAVYECNLLQSMRAQALLARDGNARALNAQIAEAKDRRERLKRTLLSHKELHGR
jgi:hypothetical protein